MMKSISKALSTSLGQDVNQREIYEFLYPYVSGCGACVKTHGYMVVYDNQLIMMSYDGAILSFVNLPPINVWIICEINKFIAAKEDPDHFLQRVRLVRSMQIFNDIYNKFLWYYENDCMREPMEFVEFEQDDLFVYPTFQEYIKGVAVNHMNITNKAEYYSIPISKAILPINKGDTCSLVVCDLHGDNTRIFKFKIHKKKLKTDLVIYTRQFVFPVGTGG